MNYKLKDGFKEILIQKDKIEEVRYFKKEKKIDLNEKIILPGFIDSHTHLIHHGLSLFFPDIYKTDSLEEAIQKVYEFHKKNLPFIIALNFDESKWKEKRLPTKFDLDKISRKKIVVFRRICGHLAVTNTKGIEFFSKFGKIEEDTGTMKEEIPLKIFTLLNIPEDIFLYSLEKGIKEAIKKGITSSHEMVGKKGFYYFLKLKEKGKLKLKIRYYAPKDLFTEIEKIGIIKGYGDEFFRFCGIKIFTDGSIGSEKAAISFYYKNSRKRGEMLISKREYQKILKKCEEKGIQLAIHAIGDRAIKNVLKWSKEIIKKTDLRHRIEHAEMIDLKTAEEFKEMGFTISIQPNFIKNWQFKNGMYEEKLGEKWIYKMNPLKSLIKLKTKFGFGSDCMPLSPLYGIEGAINHPNPEEKITLKEAIKIYTEGSSLLSFDEQKVGKIKKGYLADLIVIENKKIKKVIINGEIVYS